MKSEYLKQLKYASIEINVTANGIKELAPYLRADKPNDVVDIYVRALNSAKKRIDTIIEGVENGQVFKD